MSMTNLVKDMTKRELYVLVLVSGMLPDADAAWLALNGDNIIKSAELMADKMLSRVPEFKPVPPVKCVGEGSIYTTVNTGQYCEPKLEGNDLGNQEIYEDEVVGTLQTVTEEVTVEDLDADGRRC